MYIATAYETDNGVAMSYAVAIHINYNNEPSPENIIQSTLVPSILMASVKWFSRPCSTKLIVARHAIIKLFSGDTLQIAYPFRPGSAEWLTFWQQLQSPEIVSAQGVGEKITDKLLRSSLNL